MPAPALDFWFEFASTYSYPAAMRIGALAQDAGVIVRWQPFLLGPIFKAQGWENSPFNLYEAKGRYMWRDLERICAALDLPFRKPDVSRWSVWKRVGARNSSPPSIARNLRKAFRSPIRP
jgi:2-hydroxychromene-2-carboxylate isomerase